MMFAFTSIMTGKLYRVLEAFVRVAQKFKV